MTAGMLRPRLHHLTRGEAHAPLGERVSPFEGRESYPWKGKTLSPFHVLSSSDHPSTPCPCSHPTTTPSSPYGCPIFPPWLSHHHFPPHRASTSHNRLFIAECNLTTPILLIPLILSIQPPRGDVFLNTKVSVVFITLRAFRKTKENKKI